MQELAKRVMTALIGIPIFLLALAGPPTTVFPKGSTWLLLVLLIALLGTAELLLAFEKRYPDGHVNRPLAMIAVYLPVDSWLGMQLQAPFLPALRLVAVSVVLAALAWEVWQAERTRRLCVWGNVGAATLVALYPGVLLSLWVKLRLLDVGCSHRAGWLSDGVPLILLACVAVWVGDSAAYLLGTRFGRRQMAPVLSPRKSWEGAVAGVLFGAAAAVLASFWIGLSPIAALVLGIASTCAGQVGDLFESALKRELAVKDFGGLLPGHGGVMDRFDSLLFALPVVYILSHFLPICP
jgi:phosphatidate cytidylyltransferase